MKKIVIISFILFLVSIVVITASFTALILGVNNELVSISGAISMLTLTFTSLISIPRIIGCYMEKG